MRFSITIFTLFLLALSVSVKGQKKIESYKYRFKRSERTEGKWVKIILYDNSTYLILGKYIRSKVDLTHNPKAKFEARGRYLLEDGELHWFDQNGNEVGNLKKEGNCIFWNDMKLKRSLL